MSYVVLARKWRPQRFEEVLGQEHVTRTLRNAFASGRIAQTFLFSGPRGVGKTSAARILAKALCCEKGEAATPDPCGVCAQCVAITDNASTDVIEIDAASHTGVDNVREVIVEAVRYMPSSARYKVYIIDEVHMLSASSFNALLKTFEEPPPHVKFVLATTEVHKLPVTILSRCQRYDFRLIASARIQARLSEILAAEGIEHDPGALALVARFADGSMRDAQSVLEQVLAYAGGRRLDGALVRDALGVVDAAMIHGTFEAIFRQRPDEVLEHIGEVHARGLGHTRFAASLVEHARDLVVARVMPSPGEAIDRPLDEIEALVAQAGPREPETLERLFEQLCRIQEEVARTPQPRYALEVGLASLAAGPVRVPLERLLDQLERVERALGSGGPPAARGGAALRSSRPREPQEPLDRTPNGSRSSARGKSSASRAHRGDGGEPSSEPLPAPSPSSEPPWPDEPPPWMEDGGAIEPPMKAPRDVETASYPQQRATTTEAPPPSPPPNDLSVRSSPEDEPLEERYRRFVKGMARKRPALGATLHQVRPLAFSLSGVRLACETAFDDDKLAEPETRAAIEAAVEAFFKQPVPLEIVRAVRGPRGEAPRLRPSEPAPPRRSSRAPSAQRSSASTASPSPVPSAKAQGEDAPPRTSEASTPVPRTLVEMDEQKRAERIADKEAQARARPAVRAIERELGASIAQVRVLGETDEGDDQ